LELTKITIGQTNILYKISSDDDGKKFTVMFRINGEGTNNLINRDSEVENLKEFEKTGMGPKIYGMFKNGYIFEFFPGRSLTTKDLRAGNLNARIGKELATWHKQDVKIDRKTHNFWLRFDDWISQVPTHIEDEKKKNKNNLKNLDGMT